MSTKCSGCGKAIQSLDFLECSCCQETYDLLCLTMDKDTFAGLSQDAKDLWVCPLCSCSRPKGDNTHTPIGSPAGTLNNTYNTSDRANTTLDRVNTLRGNRKQPPVLALPSNNPDSENIAQLVTEVRCLREETQEQNKEIVLLRQDMQFLKEKLTAIPETFAVTVEALEKKITNQEAKTSGLEETVSHLQALLNIQEQNSLRNEFEIAGVPEAESENLEHVVLVTAARLGVELTAADVDGVSRVGPKRPQKGEYQKWMPRPIVVRVLRRSKRDELLQAAKSRRNLNSDIVAQGTASKLYFNERLTKINRALFKEARTRAQLHDFRFCWVRNGAIYIRQSEKKPAFLVQSSLDLDLRLGPSTASVTKAQDFAAADGPQLQNTSTATTPSQPGVAAPAPATKTKSIK